MNELLDYTKENYSKERLNDPTFTPEPGRYEGAFVNTDSNKRLNAEYNAKALGLISQPSPTMEKPLIPTNVIPTGELKTPGVSPFVNAPELPSDAQKKLDAARQAETNKAIQQQRDKAASRAIQESLKNRFGGK